MLRKRAISLLVALLFVFSCTMFVSAQERPIPTTLDKPQDLFVTDDDGILRPRWTNPAGVIDVSNVVNDSGFIHSASLYYVFDWKKNDGAWNIGLTSDDPNYVDDTHGPFTAYMPSVQYDEKGASQTFFVSWHFDPNASPADGVDVKNNTYYFRMRYVLEPYDSEFETVYSDYSNEFAIGKDANVSKITKLETPQKLSVEVKKNEDGKPYFHLNWDIPQSVTEANKQISVAHLIDFKIGDGKWLSESVGKDGLPGAPSHLLLSSDDFDPVEKNFVEHVEIEENTYWFRVAFEGDLTTSEQIYSGFSNIVSTKVEAYTDASSWAKPELDEAYNKGLIPDSLVGVDMTKPITREEFAELAVRLYEKTSGKVAEPVSPNPFSDTKNPEVLKAFALGITNGYNTEQTLFAPKLLTNREQVATMLSRTISIMTGVTDKSTVGAPTFTDQKNISSWALEHVLYMAKLEIIKGTNGKFMPKATTQAQIAANYATTTREQAVAMSLRSFKADFGK